MKHRKYFCSRIHIPLYVTPDVDNSQITSEYLSRKIYTRANIISNDAINGIVGPGEAPEYFPRFRNNDPMNPSEQYENFQIDSKFVQGDANSFYIQLSAKV